MSARQNLSLRVVVSVIGACASAVANEPAKQPPVEGSVVFEAVQVIPPQIIRGSNYRIAERVPVEHYAYVFTIESDYGTITAQGRDMLDLRLRELNSIEFAKTLSNNPKVVDGILSPLENTGKGLVLIATDPLGSLKRAPEGFARMVNQYADPADRRAGIPERRKIATELDCDPETNNPVLKKLLDELALQQLGGSLVTRAAIAFVPGLTLLPTTAEIEDLVANNPPSVIHEKLDKELKAAGVEHSLRTRFLKSPAFTTMQRLQLVDTFRALSGVEGREALLEAAADAQTQERALGAIREGKMLADIHAKKPIRGIDHVGLPIAVLPDATHVVVCPYDYVTNTQELMDGVQAYRANNPGVKTVFIAAHKVSPDARKTLESAATIVEGGPSAW